LTTVLVVALKRRCETTKWTIPTSKSPPPSKKCHKNRLLLCLGEAHLACWGCSYKFSLYITPKTFSPPWGAGAPTAPPGYAYAGWRWREMGIQKGTLRSLCRWCVVYQE